MKDGNKVLVGLGIGMIAGGVAGYFLASDEGKEFQKKSKKQMKKLQADVKQTLKENSELISEKVDMATENAKTWASEIAETAKSKIVSTSNIAEKLAEEAQDDFKSGAEKARARISKKARTVTDIVENGQA
jgi:gas vesicle protein